MADLTVREDIELIGQDLKEIEQRSNAVASDWFASKLAEMVDDDVRRLRIYKHHKELCGEAHATITHCDKLAFYNEILKILEHYERLFGTRYIPDFFLTKSDDPKLIDYNRFTEKLNTAKFARKFNERYSRNTMYKSQCSWERYILCPGTTAELMYACNKLVSYEKKRNENRSNHLGEAEVTQQFIDMILEYHFSTPSLSGKKVTKAHATSIKVALQHIISQGKSWNTSALREAMAAGVSVSSGRKRKRPVADEETHEEDEESSLSGSVRMRESAQQQQPQQLQQPQQSQQQPQPQSQQPPPQQPQQSQQQSQQYSIEVPQPQQEVGEREREWQQQYEQLQQELARLQHESGKREREWQMQWQQREIEWQQREQQLKQESERFKQEKEAAYQKIEQLEREKEEAAQKIEQLKRDLQTERPEWVDDTEQWV